jgi:NMD protein affecting ribosome stability and mRNA decay
MPLNKFEIPVLKDEQESDELTEVQNEQVDLIHHVAYCAMCDILHKNLDWNMEWIGEVCDALCDIAVSHLSANEKEVYPYIDS